MNIKFRNIAHRFSQYDKVVLYGAGVMAQKVYEGISDCRISISFCVVTEKKENYFMGSIPVFSIEECKDLLKDKNTIILIAVSNRYEKEIEEKLIKLKINTYCCLSEFLEKGLLKEYNNKTIDQCIEEITEWRIANSQYEWKRFELIKKEIQNKIQNNIFDKNRIIFAIGDLSPRAIKIIKALKKKNMEILVLFYPDANIRSVCVAELLQLNVKHKVCECVEELLYDIIVENAGIVHILSCECNTVIPYILVKMSSILPKLVYDEYDIINEFYYNYPNDSLEGERFCLENADGICNRGYELNYLVKNRGYHFKGDAIQFFDYCRDDEINEFFEDVSDSLSICYAGGLITEKQYPNSNIIDCWIEFARICEKAHCHLHIYPAIWLEENYLEYIELDKVSEYFHFHHPVLSGVLKKELSQYDYGINPIKSGFLKQEILAHYQKEKMIYGVTNHFYDYLDAGLPIIAAWPVLFAKSFEEKGVLLPWTIEEYDFDFLRKNKKIYRERAKKLQNELQIQKHIHKLIRFYNNLEKIM